MTALRWALGLVIVLLGGGLVLLFVVSNGFRRSFGASENSPLLLMGPLAAATALLLGAAFPEQRTVLHVGAVAALALAGFCIWMLVKESARVLWLGLLYLGAWLLYYWHAAWRPSP